LIPELRSESVKEEAKKVDEVLEKEA
jgi:hypothetical protein